MKRSYRSHWKGENWTDLWKYMQYRCWNFGIFVTLIIETPALLSYHPRPLVIEMAENGDQAPDKVHQSMILLSHFSSCLLRKCKRPGHRWERKFWETRRSLTEVRGQSSKRQQMLSGLSYKFCEKVNDNGYLRRPRRRQPYSSCRVNGPTGRREFRIVNVEECNVAEIFSKQYVRPEPDKEYQFRFGESIRNFMDFVWDDHPCSIHLNPESEKSNEKMLNASDMYASELIFHDTLNLGFHKPFSLLLCKWAMV